MTTFWPQPPSDDEKRVVGDLPFASSSGPHFESAIGSDYTLRAQGIATESSSTLPVYEAGSVFSTAQGDYVTVQDTRVKDDGTIETYQYTAYDAGVDVLVTVGDEQPTTELPLPESVARTSITDDTTNPVAYGAPLLTDQATPDGGDISLGTSFQDDPAAVIDGLASAVATINTGDSQEQAS